MELHEIIKKRRSIRSFENRLIEKILVEKLIDAAAHAPSACNGQGWKFIIVDQQNLKDAMVNLGGSILIKSSPMGILVLYDNRTKNIEYHDDIQSAAAAVQNIHLAATELGLGTCWICHLPNKKQLKKVFKIPSYFSPIAYILVGHPINKPQTVARKYSLPEIMNYNQFSHNWPIDKINPFMLFIKKIIMRIYYILPPFIKKSGLNKFIDSRFVKKFKN